MTNLTREQAHARLPKMATGYILDGTSRDRFPGLVDPTKDPFIYKVRITRPPSSLLDTKIPVLRWIDPNIDPGNNKHLVKFVTSREILSVEDMVTIAEDHGYDVPELDIGHILVYNEVNRDLAPWAAGVVACRFAQDEPVPGNSGIVLLS